MTPDGPLALSDDPPEELFKKLVPGKPTDDVLKDASPEAMRRVIDRTVFRARLVDDLMDEMRGPIAAGE